ncbi:MAG: adenylate kinase family protein [Candidatus Aenigmatarchaeota archaeon]
MRVAITGTPGTGKTTVGKRLSEKTDLEYVSINDLARKEDCISGRDRARESDIIDIDCLQKVLDDYEDCILDGHVSHNFDVDLVIVLRAKPKVLKRRLEDKGWSSEKIRENVESELIGLISYEAHRDNEETFDVDTTDRDEEAVVEAVKNIIEGEERDKYLEPVDWTEAIENLEEMDD